MVEDDTDAWHSTATDRRRRSAATAEAARLLAKGAMPTPMPIDALRKAPPAGQQHGKGKYSFYQEDGELVPAACGEAVGRVGGAMGSSDLPIVRRSMVLE